MLRLMRLAILILIASTLSLQGQAPNKAASDSTVVPGKRVGAIGKYTSADMLSAIYGAAQVQHRKLPTADGELQDTTLVCPGTALELAITWEDGAHHQRIHTVALIGRGWALPTGLKLGITPAEVEKINGCPFELSGFGNSKSGQAKIATGSLANGFSLRFALLNRDYPDSIRGDLWVKSDSHALVLGQAVLTQISVVFP
jgi:hypothetical protein